jgi:hypothetical protein
MAIRGLLIGICAALLTSGPTSNYNVPGQARTRTCAAMKGDRVPLRFADGTPTGFYARADDPSKQGENQPDCPVGSLELDAQEIITTGDGMRLYFHPGGGPGHYRDPVENGQYGHIAIDDLKSPPTPRPQNLNGKPAPATGARYLITPTTIPHDMWYKPNVDENGRSGSTYFTYGNPGYDKTNGRGDWTYICWSWVQNGGPEYPANKVGGGGIVRALARRGQLFVACDVSPAIGYSWGADNKVNGRVTAIYGKTTAGPGEQGSEIYGWLPHSFQKTGDIIVPCVRRAPAQKPPTGARPSAEKDRAVRMALNLLTEVLVDPPRRRELLKQLSSEPLPAARMELLTELSRMDDADTIAAMDKVLREDTDPRVREQARVLIGFMRSGTALPAPTTQPRRD